MERHGLVRRKKRDSALVQKQHLGSNHKSHNLSVDHIQNLGLEESYETENENNDDHDLDLANAHDLEHENGYTHDHENVILYREDYELNMNEDDTQEIKDNLDLAQHEDHDYGIQQAELLVNSPVVQSRTLVVAPTYELFVGQEFPDVASCRRALRDTAIALHFEIHTVKSDKNRFTAKCATEGCPWRIHAARIPGTSTFTIRTIYADHTCGGIGHLGHQQASVQWIANSVEERLKENPECKPKEILEEIHRVHGITLTYKQAWRGRERMMATLRGTFEEDYRLLPQYCDQIQQTNERSIASVYVDPVENCFQRLFISFQASIYGFLNACRPLLGVDRTVLKSKYLGTLLFATGFDGEGSLFPLAFGVVEEETDENWMWFFSELHNLLEINAENMPRLTILSDRQKGIADAVEARFPTAFHGFCMSHLSEKFRSEFDNSLLVSLFWDAANALTVLEYESKILEIEQISQEAAFWIRRVPPRLWATAYFEGTRFGHLTANIAESLNSWILEASSLPIIQMMECIRRQLMTWFNERREISTQWTSILIPSAERSVSEALERARTFQVLRANDAEFEVISHEGTNIVDIRNRYCLCRGWQLMGLPCAHAVAALLSCRQNVHRFTESCFTVNAYKKTYSQTLHPVPDRSLWNESVFEGGAVPDLTVKPPKSLRPPKQKKRRGPREERTRAKRIVHCSRCNQTGHFRTTCSAPL